MGCKGLLIMLDTAELMDAKTDLLWTTSCRSAARLSCWVALGTPSLTRMSIVRRIPVMCVLPPTVSTPSRITCNQRCISVNRHLRIVSFLLQLRVSRVVSCRELKPHMLLQLSPVLSARRLNIHLSMFLPPETLAECDRSPSDEVVYRNQFGANTEGLGRVQYHKCQRVTVKSYRCLGKSDSNIAVGNHSLNLTSSHFVLLKSQFVFTRNERDECSASKRKCGVRQSTAVAQYKDCVPQDRYHCRLLSSRHPRASWTQTILVPSRALQSSRLSVDRLSIEASSRGVRLA